jgi:peptidoglycan/LPS O-acetylase OafA/YrhL
VLGYIRLLLATVVLLSHVDVRIYSLNPGVIAVVMFYMLAGVVVTHLWHEVIADGPNKLWRFYRDRLLRITPLYFYAALLVLLFLLITDYGDPHYKPLALLNNILIIPLNYYMYLDSTVMSAPAWNLIPQAWSLGAELQAYLVLPLALVYPRIRLVLFGMSFAVYIAANLTYINADHYGYRLLPGVLYVFLIGSYLKESQAGRHKITLPLLFFVALSLVYLLFEGTGLFPRAYMKETLIGMLIGIPLITTAYLSSIKLPYNRFMGSLSYGVFLTHFLVIWLLDFWDVATSHSLLYWALLLGMTAIISIIGVFLAEKPLLKRRQRT